MASKRTRVRPRGDTRHARRDVSGRFQKLDDAGAAARSDGRQRAGGATPSGEWTRGDREAVPSDSRDDAVTRGRAARRG